MLGGGPAPHGLLVELGEHPEQPPRPVYLDVEVGALRLADRGADLVPEFVLPDLIETPGQVEDVATAFLHSELSGLLQPHRIGIVAEPDGGGQRAPLGHVGKHGRGLGRPDAALRADGPLTPHPRGHDAIEVLPGESRCLAMGTTTCRPDGNS